MKNVINDSMNALKQWSNKNTFNVIFDSDIDGDGSKNVLHNRVLNKSNLYFITFDGNNNVFGGYLSEKIYKDGYIYDDNSFVFSLIRDGNVKNTKYPIKPDKSNYAFALWNNNEDGYLYKFGGDICVNRIGNNRPWCQLFCYNYDNEQNPLIDNTNSTYFQAKRIIVIEMN